VSEIVPFLAADHVVFIHISEVKNGFNFPGADVTVFKDW